MMHKLFLCGILGCSSLWLTGCGSAAGTVRGQSPSEHVQFMPANEAHNHATTEHVEYHNGDACQYCGSHCGGTCNMCMGYGWRPHHRHTYKYKRPELSYPPHNGPTGTVVYPYYTVKGPDDFFLK